MPAPWFVAVALGYHPGFIVDGVDAAEYDIVNLAGIELVSCDRRTSMLTSFAWALGCAISGCAEPVEPAAVIRPSATVGAPAACGRIKFSIANANSATWEVPDRNCGAGLVLINVSGVRWQEASNRLLTISLRVLNTSGQAVQLPLRLELPVEGKSVLVPPNQPSSKIVPLNMDSTLANDRKLWLVGGTGTLAAGDSTAERSLDFRIEAPVAQGLLWFVSAGEEIATVPMQAPDTVPAWFRHDSSHVGGMLKRIVVVRFRTGASQSERQAAVNLVGGTVVGGWRPASGGEGYYNILVADDGSGSELSQAILVLEQVPAVIYANRTGRVRLFSRRPNDGPGWQRNDWNLGFGTNLDNVWGFKDLRAPLAWGCEAGDSALRIGVVDIGFSSVDLQGNVEGSIPAPHPLGPSIDHGFRVSSLIAARGDNGGGTTGMMWRARLLLRQPAVDSENTWDRVAEAIAEAARAGATIVNLAMGPVEAGSNDTSTAVARLYAKALKAKLDSLRAESRLPLLIVAAGQPESGLPGDAEVSGAPMLVDLFPGNVLAVGASSRQPESFNFRGSWSGSRHGRLVQVYAPGEDIWTPSLSGSGSYEDGTSLSAPFVTGIAGLLKSFDPSLTPPEIKQLILDGAQRGNVPIIGIGVSETVFLANAYESLKLVAQRTGVPICGNEVGLDNTGALKIARQPGVLETIALPGVLGNFTSVAQGGRLVAGIGSNGADPVAKYFRLQNGSWQQSTTSAPGVVSVQFLERDTAVVKLQTLGTIANGGPLTLTVIGDSGLRFQNRDLGNSNVFDVSVAPDGGWVYYLVRSLNAASLFDHTFYVDSLGQAGPRGAPASVRTWSQQPCDATAVGFCPDIFSGAAASVWSHDSRWVTAVQLSFDNYCDIVTFQGCGQFLHTKYDRFTTLSGAKQLLLSTNSWTGLPPLLSGDDGLWRECTVDDNAVVSTVERVPLTLAQLSLQSGCQLIFGPGLVANAPAFASARKP